MSKTYYLKDGYPVNIEANQFVVCFPAGGGFQHRIPLEQFLEDFQKDRPEPVMRPALFSIDGGPQYLGYHKGQRWNSWACPCFTHETLLQIAEETGGPGYDLRYEADTDRWAFHTPDNDEPDYWERGSITVGDKVIEVFSVGAGSWCWDVTELVKEN